MKKFTFVEKFQSKYRYEKKLYIIFNLKLRSQQNSQSFSLDKLKRYFQQKQHFTPVL